ncbi:MAG: SAM-dependent chlorinase/fluorinase [bacterium]
MITLITDFGFDNHFVGTMYGVILGINPDVKIVDICHEVKPHDIYEAAYFLEHSYKYFPRGTVHVVVVDPGVGSLRRPLLLSTGDFFFIAPDNGVLSPIMETFRNKLQVIHLTNHKFFLENPSKTFHGRDIFAPVAAYLSLGVSYQTLGELIEDYYLPKIKKVIFDDKGSNMVGSVIFIDRFGNIVTNIDKRLFEKAKQIKKGEQFQIKIKDHSIEQIKDYYAQGAEGELIAIFGSSDKLEISINKGMASKFIGVTVGEEIKILLKGT